LAKNGMGVYGDSLGFVWVYGGETAQTMSRMTRAAPLKIHIHNGQEQGNNIEQNRNFVKLSGPETGDDYLG
jgi:hypothetical protein